MSERYYILITAHLKSHTMNFKMNTSFGKVLDWPEIRKTRLLYMTMYTDGTWCVYVTAIRDDGLSQMPACVHLDVDLKLGLGQHTQSVVCVGQN